MQSGSCPAHAFLVLIIVGAATVRLDRDDMGYGHAGLLVGWLLVAISAVIRIADVVVAAQIPNGGPRRPGSTLR